MMAPGTALGGTLAGGVLSDDARPMARALLTRAMSTFRHVPAEDRGPALTAIDGFLAGPTPTRFLLAVRVLHELRRNVSVHVLRVRGSEHAFEQGLRALRNLPSLDGGLVDALAKLPVDLETGPRLRGLATLLGVTETLSQAAEAAAAQHRTAIGLPSAEIALAARGRLLAGKKRPQSSR